MIKLFIFLFINGYPILKLLFGETNYWWEFELVFINSIYYVFYDGYFISIDYVFMRIKT